MLKLERLSCGYKNKLILSPISAAIEEKSLLFLIGPNGSGKSTLLRTIVGILNPLTGTIRGEKVAYLPALVDHHDEITAQDVFDIYNIKNSKWFDANVLVSLKVNSFLTTPLQKLSSGEKQRVFLAATLLHTDNLIALDEPLNFLDWVFQLELVRIIEKQRQLGRTFIIATHQLDWALKFKESSTWVLHKGALAVVGATKDVLVSPQIKSIFKFNSKITDNPLDGSHLLALAARPSGEG